MFYDIDQPNVTLSDWQKFRNEFGLRPIKQVIDRDEACLPEWFVPLARGVAIASDTLLRKAGHQHGMDRPDGWSENSPGYFVQYISRRSFLLVRKCEETGLWTIERLGPARQSEVDEVLVSTFGCTPIFTRTYQAAMRLAMHCDANGPPTGLRWFKADLERDKLAIELARQRRIDEALFTHAQPKDRLH